MTVTIASAVLDAIVAEANGSPAREICGLLIDDGEMRALSCRNVSDRPTVRFEIDPATLIAALRAERAGGGRVVGCYHSHPGGPAEPSPRDAADAAADGRLWLIVGRGGEARLWRAVDGGAMHGRFDPVALHVAG